MDYGILVYSSITMANRAKKLAKDQIGYMGIIQIPSKLGVKGCNYSVRCKLEDLKRLESLSVENGLKIKAMFRETLQDGEKVYTRL